MPYFKIETNKSIDESMRSEFLAEISGFLAKILGKPEDWIMISIHQNIQMMFQGNTKPAAYLELKSISLSEEKCNYLSKAICEFMESELSIPAERIYIEFIGINGKMFGWNKTTF